MIQFGLNLGVLGVLFDHAIILSRQECFLTIQVYPY